MKAILIFEKHKLMFTIQQFYMPFENIFMLKCDVASYFVPPWA